LSSSSGLYNYYSTAPTFTAPQIPLLDAEANFNWLVDEEQIRARPIPVVFRCWDELGYAIYRLGQFSVSDGINAIRSLDDQLTLEVFPNPVSEKLYIRSAIPLLTDYSIFNAAGKVVQRRKIKGDGTIEIDNLNSGHYILKMENYKAVLFIKK